MKTRIFALAVALAMSAMLPTIPTQAATPTDFHTPPAAGIGTHAFTQHPTVSGGNCLNCGMSVGTFITLNQWSDEKGFFQAGPTVVLVVSAEPTFTLSPPNFIPVFGPPRIRVESFGSATFAVVGAYDFFTFSFDSSGFGFSINQGITDNYIATPLPAALPLFAAGLGITGLLGWRRKRKGSSPSVTANSVYASEFSGRAS